MLPDIFHVKLFFLSVFLFAITVYAQEKNGTIIGSIERRGKPFKHRMHLHYANGMFLGAQETGSNGNFAFTDLPMGEYFAILGAVEEVPFTWRTTKFSLDELNPVFSLGVIDPFKTKIIFPTDGASFSPENINENNPLIFRWTPFHDFDESGVSNVEYQVEIFRPNHEQRFVSQRIKDPVYCFDGRFPDGTRLQAKPYQWRLRICPANSIWRSMSHARDLLPGNSGEIRKFEGKQISLEAPLWYKPTIEKFDLVNFLDIAYQIEYKLSGVSPFHGDEKGSIIYDPTITWAHSGFWVGLPIHFGKGWFKEGEAPWFGFFHEMGHDFQTGAIRKFSDLIVHQETGIPIYSGFVEGFASIAHFYAGYILKKSGSHQGINEKAYHSMMEDVNSRRITYTDALKHYEKNGAVFNHINPDMVDGMLIQICDKFGWDNLPVFFRYFHDDGPVSGQIVKQADNTEKRVTVIIAALSSAMGSDLRSQFRQWNFPIDSQYYEKVTKTITD